MTHMLYKQVAVSEAGLVFNPVTGESFTVNPIGISILNHLRDGRTLDDICRVLMEDYQVEPDVAERDVMDFLNLLKNYQLIAADEN
jgi:PqqD family protein of HPr-rel-A system